MGRRTRRWNDASHEAGSKSRALGICQRGRGLEGCAVREAKRNKDHSKRYSEARANLPISASLCLGCRVRAKEARGADHALQSTKPPELASGIPSEPSLHSSCPERRPCRCRYRLASRFENAPQWAPSAKRSSPTRLWRHTPAPPGPEIQYIFTREIGSAGVGSSGNPSKGGKKKIGRACKQASPAGTAQSRPMHQPVADTRLTTSTVQRCT